MQQCDDRNTKSHCPFCVDDEGLSRYAHVRTNALPVQLHTPVRRHRMHQLLCSVHTMNRVGWIQTKVLLLTHRLVRLLEDVEIANMDLTIYARDQHVITSKEHGAFIGWNDVAVVVLVGDRLPLVAELPRHPPVNNVVSLRTPVRYELVKRDGFNYYWVFSELGHLPSPSLLCLRRLSHDPLRCLPTRDLR